MFRVSYGGGIFGVARERRAHAIQDLLEAGVARAHVQRRVAADTWQRDPEALRASWIGRGL